MVKVILAFYCLSVGLNAQISQISFDELHPCIEKSSEHLDKPEVKSLRTQDESVAQNIEFQENRGLLSNTKLSSRNLSECRPNHSFEFSTTKGDSISFANEEIEAYVKSFASPILSKKNGKEKKNKHYNESFAALLKILANSEIQYHYTDDAGQLYGNNTVGEIRPGENGQIIIVVPKFESKTDKKSLQLIIGGRANVLAEETFHAFQIENGTITLADGFKGFKAGKSTLIAAEVDAKIFAAGCGMSTLTTPSVMIGYRVPTMANLIRKAKGDRRKVLDMITDGGKGTAVQEERSGKRSSAMVIKQDYKN